MNYLSQEDQRDELRGRAIEDVTQKFRGNGCIQATRFSTWPRPYWWDICRRATRVSGSATACSTFCTTSAIWT